MLYHLDTIPIWNALEQQTGCPLCELYQVSECAEVEHSLGGSLMEPDVRIKANLLGICTRHHQQLSTQHNKLGHAILTDSHAKEVLKQLDTLISQAAEKRNHSCWKKPSPAMGARILKKLEDLTASCVICDGVETHMSRYIRTFIYLWEDDSSFRKRFSDSKGVCIPHAARLLQQKHGLLSNDRTIEFTTTILALVKTSLVRNEEELEWFTRKFDYRNSDKSWKNSKDALERTINQLRGRCMDIEKPRKAVRNKDENS